MERINEFLDARPAVTDADVPRHRLEDPAPIRGGITFRNVSYVYRILGSAHWIVFPSKFSGRHLGP
ncbi:MAG: hypothetical protein IPI72_09865 [Flavobacteriales bacterium]|nr:hypothetical protein [Flavobacteriales bacterium]